MFTSQRTKQGTLQGTHSQRYKANLAKSLVCFPSHRQHPKLDREHLVADRKRSTTHNKWFCNSGADSNKHQLCATINFSSGLTVRNSTIVLNINKP